MSSVVVKNNRFLYYVDYSGACVLEELVAIHEEVMAATPTTVRRYLYEKINWQQRGLCVLGDRGVGKTTLLCQDLLARYRTPARALYISADHVNVISYGLVSIAAQFFAHGGEALYIDEVHKYPEWSTEIKNILDAYKGRQVVFSASSSLDLHRSKGDLSRRVVYHRLLGLSFREYLFLAENIEMPVLAFSDILHRHTELTARFSSLPILKFFKEYLEHGYYPFFTEGLEDYVSKVSNVIEKVLFEDISVVYNLRQSTLPIMKKILWLVATSNGLTPNIDKMSKNLGISRDMVYNCLEYLRSSGLLNDLFSAGKGNTLIRKPGKVYLNNANLLHAIHGSLKLENNVGGIRETFFVNQVGSLHKISLHEKSDFFVDDKWMIEVGGRGKNDKQVRGEGNAYLVMGETKSGFGNRIPLYLFGFLY